MDVGCGAGSLLDMTKGVTKKQLGIEPCQPYRKALISKGFTVFHDLQEATSLHKNTIDYAFSIQVIEHVINPRKFLENIKSLMKPGGSILLSTPNREEILMTLIKKEYSSFFYRTQHRWYFDEKSLIYCAELAGFKVELISFIHRQPMSNTLFFFFFRAQKGSLKMNGINIKASKLWSNYLEETKQSCTIYLKLKLS